MIGVNTFCAPIVTMVNRQPVSYAEAVRRYRELVPVDQPNTVDPAVKPRGKRYDFDGTQSAREFFADNFQNKHESIYVIGTTNNRSWEFKDVNEVSFNIIHTFGKNPLLGFWFDDGPMPDGTKIQLPFKDTSFVKSTTDEEEAKRMAVDLDQGTIAKVLPDGIVMYLTTVTDSGGP